MSLVVIFVIKWKIDKYDCIKVYNLCIDSDIRNKVKR